MSLPRIQKAVSERLSSIGSMCGTSYDKLPHVMSPRDETRHRLPFLHGANTLGSKSADAETTRAAVDLKVLIEQMREQVQNIE